MPRQVHTPGCQGCRRTGGLALEGARGWDQGGTYRTDGHDRVFELAERRRQSSERTASG